MSIALLPTSPPEVDITTLIVDWLDSLPGDILVAKVSAEAAEWLRNDYPDAFADWLDRAAPTTIAQLLSGRIRSRRAATRAQLQSARFRSAVDATEDGDDGPLRSFFADRLEIDDTHTRRLVADMTGPDHLYVAASYEHEARTQMMLAEFHRAVAAKVGRRRTADVFTEDKYEEMYLSICGGRA